MIFIKILEHLSDLSDILFHIRRIGRNLNDEYNKYYIYMNAYNIEIEDKKNIKYSYLLNSTKVSKLLIFDKCKLRIINLLLESSIHLSPSFNDDQFIELINKYNDINFIIFNNVVQFIIKIDNISQNSIKILLSTPPIIDRHNYSQILELSIIYNLFEIANVVINTKNIDNITKIKYNKITIMYLYKYKHYQQINKLLESDTHDFYSDGYDNRGYLGIKYSHNLLKLYKNGYFNLIKFLISHKYIHKVNIQKILNKCLIHNQNHGLYKLILLSINYKISPKKYPSVLWTAVNCNYTEMVKLIINYYNHVNVNYVLYDRCILTLAIEHENYEIVDILLDHKDIDVNNICAGYSISALIFAIENKKYDLVNKLLNHKNINVNLSCFIHDTALFAAIKIDDKVLIKRLLMRADIDVNIKNYYDADSPLILLIEKGYIELAKLILNNRSLNINYTNSIGFDILSVSIIYEQFDFAKLILKYKNINLMHHMIWFNQNIFEIAKEKGYNKILDLLNNYDSQIGI